MYPSGDPRRRALNKARAVVCKALSTKQVPTPAEALVLSDAVRIRAGFIGAYASDKLPPVTKRWTAATRLLAVSYADEQNLGACADASADVAGPLHADDRSDGGYDDGGCINDDASPASAGPDLATAQAIALLYQSRSSQEPPIRALTLCTMGDKFDTWTMPSFEMTLEGASSSAVAQAQLSFDTASALGAKFHLSASRVSTASSVGHLPRVCANSVHVRPCFTIPSFSPRPHLAGALCCPTGRPSNGSSVAVVRV